MSGKSEARTPLRRQVTATVLVATAVFLLLVFAGLAAAKRLPEWRRGRVESALAAGDLDLARDRADRLDEDARRELLSACDLAEARQLMEAGEYPAARERFLALGNYGDAAELAGECAMLEAERLLSAGEADAAAELFRSLGGFRDAAARGDAAAYAAAEALADADPRESIRRFLALGNYADARERAVDLARAVTGEPDGERALALAEDLSSEEIALREELKACRDGLPRGIVDVGFSHTVGLRPDGTVLACGDDGFGQCGVAAWRDVTAVAAGAYHTVGLRADGTVLAAGRNTEHQCDVDGWTDIVQIAAADYATFGLRSDGTVVCCGFNDYYMLPGWTGVTFITGGSHNLGALRGDGEALSSHVSSRWDESEKLVDLAVNTAVAVGLRPDGTVTAIGADTSNWTDVTAVSAGSTCVLGLRKGGTVCSFFFREGDELDTASLTEVAALAAGGTHSAFVHRDGSVTVLGDVSRGQGDVSEWDLIDG